MAIRPDPGSPHDEHLVFGWKIVRYGVREVLNDRTKLERVHDWIRRVRPQFGARCYLDDWAAILDGRDPEAMRVIQETTDFFDLPQDRRGWWRGLVQSQPFTTIIPGETARERRAAVARHS